MGYALRIQRADGAELPLEEWSAAITATEGLRLMTTGVVITNPRSGAVIRYPFNPGDVEIFDPDEDAWVPCLTYSKRGASFEPPFDFEEPDSAFRQIVYALAARLRAQVVGDEGEVYEA